MKTTGTSAIKKRLKRFLPLKWRIERVRKQSHWNPLNLAAFSVSVISILIAGGSLTIAGRSLKLNERIFEITERNFKAERTLLFAGRYVGSNKIKLTTPDHIYLSEGRLFLPAIGTSDSFQVYYPETDLSFGATLSWFENELVTALKEKIAQSPNYLNEIGVENHRLLHIPVIGRFTYVAKGEHISQRSMYTLYCVVNWKQGKPEEGVTIEMTGFGHNEDYFGKSYATALVTRIWEKRKKRFW